MKSILISVKPKWINKIIHKIKTVEVRKGEKLYNAINKLIEENGYAVIYLYCTKEKSKYFVDNKIYNSLMSGKVVAEFMCRKVEQYINGVNVEYLEVGAESYSDYEKVLEPSCLTDEELSEYTGDLFFTAIYINSSLVVYETPLDIKHFNGIRPSGLTYMLEKAPQSWCYVETKNENSR